MALADVCKVVAILRHEQALESFLGLLEHAVAHVGKSVVAVDEAVVYVTQKGEAEAAEAVMAKAQASLSGLSQAKAKGARTPSKMNERMMSSTSCSMKEKKERAKERQELLLPNGTNLT